MGRRCRKIAFHPVGVHIEFVGGSRMAGTHHQHVFDCRCGNPGMYPFRKFFREVPDNRVVQRKFSLFRQQADCNGGKAFADGEHAVQRFGAAGRIVPFKNQFVTAHQKQTVHGNPARRKALREPDNGIARNACGLRCSFFKNERTHIFSPRLINQFIVS